MIKCKYIYNVKCKNIYMIYGFFKNNFVVEYLRGAFKKSVKIENLTL